MQRTLSAAAVALLATALAAPAGAAHIDFMVDGGFTLITNHLAGPATDIQTGDPGNILGGEREVELSFASGDGLLSTGLLVPAGPGPVGPDPSVELLLDNAVNGLGILKLTYDGVGSAGLGGLDFDTLWDSISVGVADIQGAGDLTVEVTDTASGTGSMTQSIVAAAEYEFSFADAGYAGVDFTSVDSVVVTFETTIAASDISFSHVVRTAIPEPASAMLASLALAGVSLSRRR